MREETPRPVMLYVEGGMFMGKEIVFCKDCKYWELQSIIPPIPYGYCYYVNDDGEGFDPRKWNANDFCSRGEKK